VREQLEHDRLIRLLQAKYTRKFDAVMNVGDEQVAPVKIGPNTFFPDLVLSEGKRLAGVVEVETGESVNNLEAMAQWVHFGRARVPFHLYVPMHAFDAARRFCVALKANVAELWTYRAIGDQFDLVRAYHDPAAAALASARAARAAAAASEIETRAGSRPAATPESKAAVKTTKSATRKPVVKKLAAAPRGPKGTAPRKSAKRPARAAGGRVSSVKSQPKAKSSQLKNKNKKKRK
jgi:hypothetical protein